MGQYHLVCNLDKKEYLDPHKLGSGLKLWEQANTTGGTPVALLVLLACSSGRGGGDFYEQEGLEGIIGRWAGDRVAVVGDYAEVDDLLPKDEADKIYTWCRKDENYKDITESVLPYVEQVCGIRIFGDGWRNIESVRK